MLRSTGLPFGSVEALGRAEPDDWDRARSEGAAALTALAGEPLFREAIFLSNPGLDAVLDGWLSALGEDSDGATAKKRLKTLWRYAQRFCAKNDTTAFFGPVAAGRLDAPGEALSAWPLRERTRAFVTHWAADALLQAAARELEFPPQRRPAPGVVAGAEGATVWRLDGRGVLGPDADSEGAAESGWTQLPVGMADPLAEVRRRIEAAAGAERGRWLERLDRLEACRDEFAGAPLPTRRRVLDAMERVITEVSGAAPRRKPGEFYASRTVIHEMCDRTGAPATLPPGHAALCESVTPWLELALLPAAADRLAFRAWYDARFDGGERAWREVAKAFSADKTGFLLSAPEATRALRRGASTARDLLRAAVDAHLQTAGADQPLTIDPGLLAPILAEARPHLDAAGSAFANPDIMVGEGEGGPYAVFAEAHHLAYPTPCLLPVLGCRDALLDDLRGFLAALCAPAEPALPVSYAHSFISVSEDLGHVDLQLSGLSPLGPERRASLAELRVARAGAGFEFGVATESGRRASVAPLTRLLGLDRASPAYSVSPLDLGALLGSDWRFPSSLPRISLGPLVIHRRRWRVVSSRWAGERSAEASVKRLRALAGDAFPRFTFVSPASEPKPLLFDRDSPLAVEFLLRHARESKALTFVEMLPGPEDLWLRGEAGAHTSELRLVFARRVGGT
ncbi:MAG: lantibiotic dehydratase [Myxococcota bacterium]